jgi:hypothetical protein
LCWFIAAFYTLFALGFTLLSSLVCMLFDKLRIALWKSLLRLEQERMFVKADKLMTKIFAYD